MTGQVISAEVLKFVSAFDTMEIHGYEARQGYSVILSQVEAKAAEAGKG